MPGASKFVQSANSYVPVHHSTIQDSCEEVSDPQLQRLLGGPLRFYAGFPTYYVRIAPHAMLTLIAQDFIKKSYMVSLEMERWKFCGLQVKAV